MNSCSVHALQVPRIQLFTLLALVGANQRHLAMTPADAKFGVAVFHEPRINPQAHGIPLYHFTREYPGCHLYFRREGGE